MPASCHPFVNLPAMPVGIEVMAGADGEIVGPADGGDVRDIAGGDVAVEGIGDRIVGGGPGEDGGVEDRGGVVNA
jgi:hypothetical protein